MERYVGKRQKYEVTRLVTLRHRSIMSGAWAWAAGSSRTH